MVWAKPNFHFQNMRREEIERRIEEIRNTVGFLDLPDSWVFLLSCIKILAIDYGYVRSKEQELPCDGAGDPIPLYTYPMIEYIGQLDLSEKSVFEFGAGQSSLFWRRRARSVISVENNEEWFRKVSADRAPNHEILFKPKPEEFWASIRECEQDFDVIIVDGAENRYQCAVNALGKLKRGGFIILDNSDWHFDTARFLRDSDLIQIDMSGFKPTAHHTSTTSMFLHREFNPRPRAGRQPSTPLGGLAIHSNWDKPAAG